MSESTSRRSQSQRTDRYTNYDDYSPSRGTERTSARGDYYDREAPYDTLYKRPYDDRYSDEEDQRSRSTRGAQPRSHYRENYDDDADYSRRQKQLVRREDDDRVAYGHQGGYRDERRSQSQRSQQYDDDEDEGETRQLEGWYGKEKKDLAATAIGAVAGAFLGHEAGHGKPIGTLGGAVLGGLSANAVEHAHLKREKRREGGHHNSEYDDY